MRAKAILCTLSNIRYLLQTSMPTIPTSIRRAKNIFNAENVSPKSHIPITKVPMAPSPVHTIQAVPIGMVFCAKQNRTPLNNMLNEPRAIYNPNFSGCRLDILKPTGHPISKNAANMSINQFILALTYSVPPHNNYLKPNGNLSHRLYLYQSRNSRSYFYNFWHQI